ncbi:MAG: outer membrane beta-barrel protein [Salibacteraceae bacterium]
MGKELNEDIDHLFKQRFEGLKDHSVDPAAQWESFNTRQELADSEGGSFESSAGTGGISALGVAASIAVFVFIAGVTKQDRTMNFEYEQNKEVTVSESAFKKEHNGQFAFEVEVGSSFKNTFTSEDLNYELRPKGKSGQNNFLASAMAEVGKKKENQDQIVGLHEFATNHLQLKRDQLSIGQAKNGLTKMPALVVEENAQSIFERPSDEYYPEVNEINPSSAAYVRGGLRIGNGESNCMENPNHWRANGLLSLGYAYTVAHKTWVSLEVGALSRSGNGIERSRDIDLQPLYSVLVNNYDQLSEDEEALRRESMNVRESIVAQRLDYLHAPLLIHVDLNKSSSVSIGAYADYLMRVQNESYMVYNDEDYVTTNLEFGAKNSREGLNSWRFGLVAGFERSITDHISADIRAMIPITGIYDRSSDYYLHQATNQLVDFQVALSYKI